jgi:hypothetical protein
MGARPHVAKSLLLAFAREICEIKVFYIEGI